MRKEKTTSLAKAARQASDKQTPLRSVSAREDGALIAKYVLPHKVSLTLGGVEPDALGYVEGLFLDERERAWLRIVDVIELALTNPGITNNSHAAEFCEIVRQLAVCARGDFTIDEVLEPLKTAVRAMHAGEVASKKNTKPRAWVVQKWRDRVDEGQSKAAFGRQYAQLVKAKFDCDVTPGTIEREWLPKGQ